MLLVLKLPTVFKSKCLQALIVCLILYVRTYSGSSNFWECYNLIRSCGIVDLNKTLSYNILYFGIHLFDYYDTILLKLLVFDIFYTSVFAV